MGDSLDILSEIFTQYMDPDENGEPLVPYTQLPAILKELELPDLAFPDLNTNGYIEFEPFINTLSPLLEDRTLDDDIGLQKDIFHILSRGNSQITRESLRQATIPLGLNISDQDIDGMVQLLSTESISKQQFSKLWANLNPR